MTDFLFGGKQLESKRERADPEFSLPLAERCERKETSVVLRVACQVNPVLQVDLSQTKAMFPCESVPR